MTTTTDQASSGKTRKRSLLADDSGATMVMGVFMAMMVVGMIYYVWGLGGTIIHRERMQDAADAAAFGASVFQARGMNIIAMLNVLMSVFAIIGTACRLLYTFIIATAIADDAACVACLASVVCIPASATFCEPAVAHSIQAAESDWLNDVADVCDTVAQGIHGVQVVVRTGAMVAAEGYVLTMLPQRYRPTVTTSGIFVPGSLSISIQSEDDDSTWACHHGWTGMFVRGPALALTAVGELVLFEPISVGWIAGEIAVGIQEFATEEGSEYYCAENGGSGLTFQRVPEDSWLGDQNFQNYSLVNGDPPFGWTQGGVALSNWGRLGNSAPNILGLDISIVRQLHRLSFADSEYYYEESDCDSSFPDTASVCAHEEWLWHTRWRARMRRFHAGGGVTGMLGSVLQGVQDVIVH